MTKKLTLLILLFASNYFTFSQNEPAELNDSIFQKEISESIWHASDSSQLKKHEQMFIQLTRDSLFCSYFNWIEGLYQTKCNYSPKVANDFLELELSNCTNSASLKYLYAYLERGNLEVLMLDEQLPLDERFLKKEGWLTFSNAEALLNEEESIEEEDWGK